MNFFEILSVGATILNALSGALGQLAAGQAVTAPPIRTYIGGKHVELDITVKPVA